jgi:mono/diheme cytochrome c family protein
MSEADLAAIAAYLKDQSPSGRAPPPGAADVAAMRAGEAVFVDTCAACHRADGSAEPGYFPPLAGDALVQSRDPTTVLRIILQGSRAAPTPGRPTPLTMPAFNWKLTDQQIADVATYIRSSWGNAAAPVPASKVASLRRKVSG